MPNFFENLLKQENRLQLFVVLNLVATALIATVVLAPRVRSYEVFTGANDGAMTEDSANVLMESAPAPQAMRMSKMMGGAAPAVSALIMDSAQAAENAPTGNRKLIRNGNLSFQVGKIGDAKTKVTGLIGTHQAVVINESVGDNGLNISLTIQVPYQKFDALFDGLAQLSENLINRQINVDDITKQYIDSTERLKNRELLRERYRSLLAKAQKVADVVEIERELNNVSEQIDSVKAQLKSFDQQIEFSTIHLNFFEPQKAKPTQTEPYQFGARLLAGLSDGWYRLLGFMIGLLSLWPFFIIVGGGIWFWKRRKRRR